MYCRKCGVRLEEDALFCPVCGTKVIFDDTETVPDTQEEHTSENVTVENSDSDNSFFSWKGNERSVASVILGALSLIFCISPIVGLVSAIIGMVVNRRKNEETNPSIKKTGFTLCLIGIILDGLFTVGYIIYIIFMFSRFIMW